MDILSVTETRANLKAVLDRVIADRAPIAIFRPKGESVIMVAQSEWEGMEATLHLLSSRANANELLESIAELEAGKGTEHELIEP